MNNIKFRNFTITKREILVSIVIAALMIMFGFLISTQWSESQQESDIKYNKAIQIDNDTDLFQYGINTNVGNAFVYGELKAVDSVTYPEIGGEYMYVRKVEEHYNMHTRTVTTTDSKGKKHTRTETYWTWDYAGEEDKSCKTINFCGIDFDSSKIPFPGKDYIDTLSGGYHIRFEYYGVPAVNKGTIFTNLKDKTINNTKYYNNMDLEESFRYVTTHFPMWLFWLLWIMLIGAVIYGFCYLENRWLE